MPADVKLEIKGRKELAKKMDQLVRDMAGDPMRSAMSKATLLVTRSARKNAPVDTGRLRASIVPEVRVVRGIFGKSVQGVVGSNVVYACIFRSHTRITTREGKTTIGQIQVGAMVLAQDGAFHRVLAKTKFPATEKPYLVDIVAEWRSDRDHSLTVTKDHKILVLRGGRNKWIQAGSLKLTDFVYARIKKSHSKNSGRVITCINCGKKYRHHKSGRQGKKFCSWDCRNEYWYDKGHNPHWGMRRSIEARQRMSRASKKRFREHPEQHPSIVVAQRGHTTDPERQIEQWLCDRGVAYEKQFPVGRHIVDFYVPETHTVYEADGAFWHQDQSKDISRDVAIVSVLPGVKIVHIHFFSKRHTPVLDVNPLPNVYYVVTNPGPKSYVDLETFKTVKILELTHWRYERPIGKRGCKVACLYDLAIEGVHSFLGNGILISNSYMEFGTGTQVGRPRHWPPGAALATWARRHGFSSGFQVARIIGTRGGLRGRRYLQRAIEDNKERIKRLIGNAIVRITGK